LLLAQKHLMTRLEIREFEIIHEKEKRRDKQFNSKIYLIAFIAYFVYAQSFF
jgi:hypothetical protein